MKYEVHSIPFGYSGIIHLILTNTGHLIIAITLILQLTDLIVSLDLVKLVAQVLDDQDNRTRTIQITTFKCPGKEQKCLYSAWLTRKTLLCMCRIKNDVERPKGSSIFWTQGHLNLKGNLFS